MHTRSLERLVHISADSKLSLQRSNYATDIDIDSTFESLQKSECTSCNIDSDKSAYWTPTLYYQRKDGSIVEVPQEGVIIYYLGRGSNTTIEPFPPGFKMLAGRMTLRSLDNGKIVVNLRCLMCC